MQTTAASTTSTVAVPDAGDDASTGTRPIRVLLAEDHELFLDGLLRSLGKRPELDVVGTAADGPATWERTRELLPDVLCVDVRLPGMDGLEILEAVREHDLPVRVVMLSGEVKGDVVFRAVQSGVDGYISKDSSRGEVADAVVAVGRGETVFSTEVQRSLADEVRGRAVGGEDHPALSPREHEILVLIADGLSGPAIARQLDIGAATVKTHMQNLYGKLGVADRAAAVATAMRRGLFD